MGLSPKCEDCGSPIPECNCSPNEAAALQSEVARWKAMHSAASDKEKLALTQLSEVKKLFTRWSSSELSDIAFAGLMSGVFAVKWKPTPRPPCATECCCDCHN